MTDPTRKSNPLKKRLVWWSDPGFLTFIGIYLGAGALVIIWVSHLEAKIAAQILAIFWTIMFPVIVWFFKRTLDEPHIRVDWSVVRKTKRELKHHRARVRTQIEQAEIEALKRGEKTPVLDVWRLDSTLQKRHAFFNRSDGVLIDPAQRELNIRIQIGELRAFGSDTARIEQAVLGNVGSFLKILSSDPYLESLNPFFDNIVVEIYALREDERHVDVPYPVLSLIVKAEMLPQIAELQPAALVKVRAVGEVRFDGGNEIEPHRSIQSASMSRGK